MSARAIDLPETEVKSTPSRARKIDINDKDISRFQSLVSAPIKGLLKELPNIARWQDPVSLLLPKSSLEDVYEREIEERLPTKPEFAEKSLERFGKLSPYLVGGGVSGVARAGLGAIAGQTAEELGAGPLGQSIAEAAPFAAPSFARKIVPSNAEQKAILDLGRKHGLTEEQLAPMMPESLKRRSFGKIASTGEKTAEKLKEMRKGGSAVYEALRTSPQAESLLTPQSSQQFASEMQKIGQEMPHAVRSQLQKDAADLVSSARSKGGISGADLINFYKDVSSRYNIGRSELELFKGPIKKAISSLDPELAKNFDTANKMWARQAKIASTLKPGQFDGIVDLGETYATAAAIGTGNFSLLSKILGLSGMKAVSNAMLTSPRLQNLVQQSQNALMKHNLPALKAIGEAIVEEFRSED
jgi:hypothetical protein